MKLYGVPLSPFAARVRLSIYRKGLEDRIAIARPPQDGLKTPAYLARNPMGQIPTLLLDDGTAIAESAVIVEYLEDAFPTPALRPHDPGQLARARLFLRLPDLHLRNAPRVLLSMRDPAAREPAAVEEAFGNLDRTLGYIDHYLEGGPWAVGERPSIGDSALIPVLNILTRVAAFYDRGDPFAPHPKVAAYWAAAREEPVHARVIGEQVAAAPQ